MSILKAGKRIFANFKLPCKIRILTIAMIEKFKRFIFENKLIKPKQKVLLTVSGGIDSVVMAALFRASGFDFGFAHCNFGLRGSESNADQAFVEQLATTWDIPCFVKKFDTKQYSIDHKISTQLAARELRYVWFEELIQSKDFELYATAHHLDDQVETFLINAMRGSGVAGLQGIPLRNGNCIRPMLNFGRESIEEYARVNSITFREDRSNLQDDYLRNRLRHFVLPALQQADRNFRQGFQNTFAALADTEKFIHYEIEKRKGMLLQKINNLFFIAIGEIQKETAIDFVLFEMIRDFNFNYAQVQNIITALDKEPGKRFISSTHELVIDRDNLIISEVKNEKISEYKIAEDDHEIKNPLHLTFKRFVRTDDFTLAMDRTIAQLDKDKLRFPLSIRNYEEGDFFYPLGMKGRKKLSDFFIDQKISIPEKRAVWLLLSGDEIVWVIGHRINDRYKITVQTKQIFELWLI